MLENTRKVLDAFSLNVISEAKANLSKNTSSGSLAKSLDYEIEMLTYDFLVTFYGTDYANFVDEGVQGKDPSRVGGRNKAPSSRFKFGSGKGSGRGTLRGAIDKWVVRKNLKGVRDKKTGRFVSRKSQVYLISRSIYFTGLRPTLFFTKPFEKYQRGLQPRLEEALVMDIEKEL